MRKNIDNIDFQINTEKVKSDIIKNHCKIFKEKEIINESQITVHIVNQQKNFLIREFLMLKS